MNRIYIFCILIPSLLIVPFTAYCSKPEINFLSFSYAKFIQENPGGNKNITNDERQLHISIAQELTKVGSQYSKLGKNKEAVEKYEEALSHHATGELYYCYGNSLFDIGYLESAIQAYKIAGVLGFEVDKFIYYNIACAYSRLKNKKMAFEYLEIAAMSGYKDGDYIKQDPGLAFLRSQTDWERWFKERKALFTFVSRKGLVAELLFYGNANDNSGNGNHGIMKGVTLTKDRFGSLNSAYYFDGHNDYIKIDNLISIRESNEVTIGYWCYLTGHIGHDICGYIAASNNALRLGLDPERHIFINAGTHADIHSDRVTFDLNKWYYYVMSVKGGGSAKVYVNGEMVFETTNGVPDILKNPPCFAIGASDEILINRSISHHIQGIIDDVQIYNRVLSGAEIEELYNSGKAISESYFFNLAKFDNFDFELGFKGWKRIGSGHQIESFVSDYKKAYQGNSSYQTCPGNTPIPYGIDSLTNELISDEFLLSRDKTKFSAYIFGGGNKDLLYIGLFSAVDDKEICRLYKSYNGANWQYAEKLLYLTKDKLVYIKIVDHAQTRWGHIAVDQIEIK